MKNLVTLLAAVVLVGCAYKPAPGTDSQSIARKPTTKPATSESDLRFRRSTATLLTGTWHGLLRMRKPVSPMNTIDPPDERDLEIGLEIDGDDVRVFLKENDKWIEAMPGRFRMVRTFTNAMIFGMTTGAGGSLGQDGWIENWSILISAQDDDTVVAEWTRIVNNIKPAAVALPVVSMGANGTLSRAVQ